MSLCKSFPSCKNVFVHICRIPKKLISQEHFIVKKVCLLELNIMYSKLLNEFILSFICLNSISYKVFQRFLYKVYKVYFKINFTIRISLLFYVYFFIHKLNIYTSRADNFCCFYFFFGSFFTGEVLKLI